MSLSAAFTQLDDALVRKAAESALTSYGLKELVDKALQMNYSQMISIDVNINDAELATQFRMCKVREIVYLELLKLIEDQLSRQQT